MDDSFVSFTKCICYFSLSVENTNQQNVIACLYEVGKRARNFKVKEPELLRIEKELSENDEKEEDDEIHSETEAENKTDFDKIDFTNDQKSEIEAEISKPKNSESQIKIGASSSKEEPRNPKTEYLRKKTELLKMNKREDFMVKITCLSMSCSIAAHFNRVILHYLLQ